MLGDGGEHVDRGAKAGWEEGMRVTGGSYFKESQPCGFFASPQWPHTAHLLLHTGNLTMQPLDEPGHL